jgi:hypothetical protein
MQLVPNLKARMVDAAGLLQSPWNSFFQQFTQAPPAVIPITVGASPFEYQAKEPGLISISGGTVSAVTFTRGSVTVTVTGQILIPVYLNDVIEVTYSVLPTMKFFPNYGNVPR